MYRDSHKAQRNSFAHHRAELLFSIDRALAGDQPGTAASAHDGTPLPELRRRVRAGLLGFTPTGALPAI